jgi:hypothetical protein
MSGGAITCIDTDFVCRNTEFRGCAAFFESGAVYVRRTNLGLTSWGTDTIAFFAHVVFADCIARELAGALGIQRVSDVTIDQCTFSDCHSGFSGGAIKCSDCNVMIILSHFTQCTGGGREKISTLGKLPFPTGGRGPHAEGGAISFVTVARVQGDHNAMGDCQLATEDCCFIGNAVLKPGETGDEIDLRRSGFDVCLSGHSTWQSFGDRFLNHREMAVSLTTDSSLRNFHSVFVGTRDRFFRTGHACGLPEYQVAYDGFAVNPEILDESIAYTPLEQVGRVDEEPVDVSGVDATPWQTRVPPATPLGRTTATGYAIGTNLSIPSFAVHSTATESHLFGISASFSVSNSFPQTAVFTRSLNVLKTAAFTGSVAFSASAAFSRSSPFTPRQTLPPNVVESFVASIVESQSMSMERVSVKVSSFSVAHSETETRVSDHQGTDSVTLVGYTTLQALLVDSIVYVPVVLPVFVTTMSRIQVAVQQQTPLPSGHNNGAIIVVASSMGLILAIFTGTAIFLLRRPESIDSYSGEGQGDGRTLARRESMFGIHGGNNTLQDARAAFESDDETMEEMDAIVMDDAMLEMAGMDLGDFDNLDEFNDEEMKVEDAWI